MSALSGHSDRVIDLAFSGDGAYIASSSLDKTIKLWDVVNWQKVHAFSVNKVGFNGIARSPDGRLLASADAIWHVESGRGLRTFKHDDEMTAVTFSPNGSLSASGGYDYNVYLWGVPH